jgi:N6-L-threonylcarbamoyladenine synthase
LLVGVNYAKGLALGRGLPLVGVNHLEGHVYSLWLVERDTPIRFPVICLIVSGGHSEIVLITGHGEYTLLGSTIDDAAGEAFDKVARLLGLSYPGGPSIERAATKASQRMISLRGEGNFSFQVENGGAARRQAHTDKRRPEPRASRADRLSPDVNIADVAASFALLWSRW